MIPRLITCLIIFLMIAGCSRITRMFEFEIIMNPVDLYEDQGLDTVKDLRGVQSMPDEAKLTSLRAAAASAAVEPKISREEAVKKAKLYLGAGITLSDRICKIWFKELGEAQGIAEANRDVLSNMGALSAAVMGLAEVSSAAVGGAAASFGFLESTLTSEVANFIVAPSIAHVENLVNIRRAEAAFTLRNISDITFFEAEAALINYDNSCSRNAVKQIVDNTVTNESRSIEGRAREKAKREKISATFVPQMTRSVLSELQKEFPSNINISEEDLYDLYFLTFRKRDLSEELEKAILEQLVKNQITDPNGVPRLRSGGAMSKVRTLLLRVGQEGRYDEELDNLILSFDTPPEVGNAPPEVGNALPEVGNAPPEVGNASPEVGNASPEVGNASPEISTNSETDISPD